MKTERFHLRLDPELKAEAKAKADKAGLSLSDFIRRSIKQCSIVKPSLNSNLKIEKERIRELHRIGQNINQIARHVNTKKEIDKNVLYALAAVEYDLDKML